MIAQIEHQRVLVAPLNWGLGHATRCVPIIQQLLHNQCTVMLATDGEALQYLTQQFPHLPCIELPSYGIRYHGGNNILPYVAWQLVRLPHHVELEHEHIQNIVRLYDLQTIVSDNRYGVWSPQCHNVFITHQLQFFLPPFWRLFRPIIHRQLAQYVNNFNECWIPDTADIARQLAGSLHHPHHFRPRKTYIGPLSAIAHHNVSENITFDFCFIISGPEKQRTVFENKIWEQLAHTTYTAIVIRGTAQPLQAEVDGSRFAIIDMATPLQVAQSMAAARYVVCRAGYSTLMDLCFINKQCLLVPTPGHPEQEYLATHLHKAHVAVIQSQSTLHLQSAYQQLGLSTSVFTYYNS